MPKILIEACVTTQPDGTSTARLRKAILDDEGHLLGKYFLTHYGEWKELLPGKYIPPECEIVTSIHEAYKEEK